MRTLADGVHVLERPQRFFGLEVGTRMTVLELSDGLLVHSPVDLDPESLSSLGKPRWVLAPNLLHHLYVGRWLEAGLQGWAARGLPQKRPDLHFAGVIEPGASPFGDEIVLLPLTCFPFSNEVLVLHKPSRTLVLTDLVFHFPPTAPLATRVAMRCAGGYPGCRATLLEKVLMHRETARREIGELLELDFDRVIMAHGDVIETGGKAALASAYRWLGVPS
jgi:hypothetical protein